MHLNKQINELTSRSAKGWRNVTVKEFDRDIRILQNEVLVLEDKLKKEKEIIKDYQELWINTLISNIELMDEYIPYWRFEAKDTIDKLKQLLK